MVEKNVTLLSEIRYRNSVDTVQTFYEFYSSNQRKFFGYLLRRSGDAVLASDLMQESFTRYLERYEERGFQVPLLYTIGRNLLFDHYRRRRDEVGDEIEELSDHVNLEHQCQVREESRQVLIALQKLDEGERDVLSLVVSSGLNYREISGLLGTSEANVKVKVHRARVKLKKILARGEE